MPDTLTAQCRPPLSPGFAPLNRSAAKIVVPTLVAMLAIQILVSFAGISAAILAPLAAEDFGVDAIHVGVYVSAIYGIAAVASLASGRLIARFGPFRVSQACLVLSALALTCAATGHVAGLAAAALLMGMAYGPATPASSDLLARRTPPRWLNVVFSAKQTGVPIGNMLAGGVLPGLGLTFGWRAAALTTAALSLTLAVGLQPMRARHDSNREAARRVLGRGLLIGPLRLVLSDPPLRRLCIASCAYSGMQVTFTALLVTYLHDGLGMPLVLAGAVLSAAQACGVGGRVLWGVVADRFARPSTVLGGLGLAMSAAALTAGAFTPDWPLAAIVIVCMIYGGTAVAWNGVFLAQVARLSPPGKAGEVTGGSAFVTFGGVVMFPAGFSAIISATGSYMLAFAAAAALTLASGIACLRAGAAAQPRP